MSRAFTSGLIPRPSFARRSLTRMARPASTPVREPWAATSCLALVTAMSICLCSRISRSPRNSSGSSAWRPTTLPIRPPSPILTAISTIAPEVLLRLAPRAPPVQTLAVTDRSMARALTPSASCSWPSACSFSVVYPDATADHSAVAFFRICLLVWPSTASGFLRFTYSPIRSCHVRSSADLSSRPSLPCRLRSSLRANQLSRCNQFRALHRQDRSAQLVGQLSLPHASAARQSSLRRIRRRLRQPRLRHPHTGIGQRTLPLPLD